MRCSGFTLLETIVCIAILAILGSLILVGVNSARESARRVECMNRQRNVVLALQNHLTQKQRYPQQLTFVQPVAARAYGFGPVFELLPFLEQDGFIEQVMSSEAYEIEMLRDNFRADWMQCPADFVDPRINLRFCVGSLPPIGKLPLDGFLNNGIFGLARAAKQSDVTRGSDATIAISERFASNENSKQFELVGLFDAFRFDLRQEFTVEIIRKLQGEQPDYLEEVAGSKPFDFSYLHTVFNTLDPPNAKVRDIHTGDPGASISARSRHSSGVNVGFVSGAVRFVSDSIDAKLWSDYGIARGQ